MAIRGWKAGMKGRVKLSSASGSSVQDRLATHKSRLTSESGMPVKNSVAADNCATLLCPRIPLTRKDMGVEGFEASLLSCSPDLE